VIESPVKENTNVRYRNVWRRNEKQEEHVNEYQVLEIVLTIFTTTKDHNEFASQEEDDRIQEEDEYEIKKKMLEFRKMMNPNMKRKITLHQRRYFSKPCGLETPIKYEY
jgi:hypothetical protein